MTLGRLLMHAGWTLAFPGAGQGAAGRRALAMVWAIGGLVTALAVTWTIWAMAAAIALRVASAIDAGVRLRRVARDDEDRNLPLYASLVGVVGFVYFQFTTERYSIPTTSMMPTIEVGDSVYIEKVTKRWSSPKRGEVIVFDHPCEHTPHIKRVIGVPGDTIETRCGKLYVNGKVVERSGATETLDGHTYGVEADADVKDFPGLDRLARTCQARTNQATGQIVETRAGAAPCDVQLHFVVPADSLFVLGDSRASSNDSRNWGVVPFGNVTGRAIGIAWPLAHAGAVD